MITDLGGMMPTKYEIYAKEEGWYYRIWRQDAEGEEVGDPNEYGPHRTRVDCMLNMIMAEHYFYYRVQPPKPLG